MEMLLLELLGKEITVVSDDGTGAETQYRDHGTLEASDGRILRLRKANEERVYYLLNNVRKVIAELYIFDTEGQAITEQGAIDIAAGDMLKELEKRVVSVWLNNSTSRTDGLMESYDETTLRVNTGGQIVYFPLSNVRLIKPTS